MNVERYLRLIAGFFVVASVALGYWVHPGWFVFTAFVGLNLFQSAFTDWCPMMTFLKRLWGCVRVRLVDGGSSKDKLLYTPGEQSNGPDHEIQKPEGLWQRQDGPVQVIRTQLTELAPGAESEEAKLVAPPFHQPQVVAEALAARMIDEEIVTSLAGG